MKIVYCIQSAYNSGGMERMLSIKANYMCDKLGHDVYVITTDQKGRKNFYEFSDKIKFIDLSIGYSELEGKSLLKKVFLYRGKRRRHYDELCRVLRELHADVAISMFGREISFLWKISDGSKKVLELHFAKYVRLQRRQNRLGKIVSMFNTWLDEIYVKKYDKFVVLTKEDMADWKKCDNITAIPNPTCLNPSRQAGLERKRVVAVGRLCYQKGFDMLISAWRKVHAELPDWSLDIYGNGEWESRLSKQISDMNLESSIKIHKPSAEIDLVYLDSSVFAFSSRYEGFGLVLVEAMSCGVPVVSFSCKCGPKDIITDGYDGYLVKEEDMDAFAQSLLKLMKDSMLRKSMGQNARCTSMKYELGHIMEIWDSTLKSLI